MTLVSTYGVAIDLGANCTIQSTISNCTFANNPVANVTLGLSGNYLLKNNIFSNPSTANVYLNRCTVSIQPLSQVTLDHNLIQGGVSSVLSNGIPNQIFWLDNITDEPGFVLGQPENTESYMLDLNSPCIDAGDTQAYVFPASALDIFGNPRIYNGMIDIGCAEWNPNQVGNEDEVIPLPLSGIYLTNFPNPFNPSTTISFTIPKDSETNLTIYNAKGQVVKTLISGQQKAGQHSIIWNGTDNAGKTVSSGVYLYRLEAGKEILQKKMILMK